MELIARPEPREAAPVSQSWERLERWLADHLLQALGTLRPPADPAALDRLEQRIGHPLPEDFRQSYLRHDGQELDDDTYEMGVLFGLPLLPLEQDEGIAWLVEHRVTREWQTRENTRGILDEWTFSPPGAMREAALGPGWVPFYWDSGRNFLGIDLDPGPNGVIGQVIPFGWDDTVRPVLATSFAHFLEDIADELEAGRGLVTDSDGETALRLKGAYLNYLPNAYRDWSEAKLPAAFQRSHQPG